MKVKIVEPGYEGFTGLFGCFEFADAISVESLSQNEVNLIASVVRIQAVDGDTSLGQNAQYIEMRELPAVVSFLKTQAEIDQEAQNDKSAQEQPAVLAPIPETAAVGTKRFERETLEKIADEEGLAGVRAVADLFGVKATSINKLIALTLQAQGIETQPAE